MVLALYKGSNIPRESCPLMGEIEETFCGQTDIRTDSWTDIWDQLY